MALAKNSRVKGLQADTFRTDRRLELSKIYRAVVICLRIALGVMFVAAAVPKILDPAKFANSMNAYQLVPLSLLGIAAWVLPWIECVIGCFLVIGYRVRLSIGVAIILMLVFLGAIISAMARGLNIDCGCFGQHEIVGWKVVVRDIALILVLTLCAVYYKMVDGAQVKVKSQAFNSSGAIASSDEMPA